MASRTDPAPPRARPLSPHIGIYKWGPHMLVSIAHRATGVAMALAGLPLFAWWLATVAGGEASYGAFMNWFTGGWAAVGYVVAVGLSFAFFQHLGTGLRHFFMDAGALFELKANKSAALLTMVGSVGLTALFWAVVTGVFR